MIDGLSKQNCVQYLSESIEADADLSKVLSVENRGLYRAFLADIEAIADAARQMFPAVEPPDEIWEHIESVIKGSKTN
jgi:hypothetical protein